MSEKNRILHSFQSVWEQTTVPARISVFAVALLSIGIVSGVGWWAMQPYYVPLLRDLEPATAGTAISVLEENNIAYKMNFSGTSIQQMPP